MHMHILCKLRTSLDEVASD